MKFLYIDTSSNYLYAAIVEDDKILAKVEKLMEHKMSIDTIPEIQKLFINSKTDPNDIDKVIAVCGPGSFTGIRMGVTVAKVFAWSLKKPITTITAMEAMAMSSKNETDDHVCVIKGGKDYVFAGIYASKCKEILKPQLIQIDKLKRILKGLNSYVIITNDDIPLEGKRESYKPDMARIVNFFRDKIPINPHAVYPEYMKMTSAELQKLRDVIGDNKK